MIALITMTITSPALSQNRKAEYDSLRVLHSLDAQGGTFTLTFQAIACYAPNTNGATLDTLIDQDEVYVFTQGVDDIVYLDFTSWTDSLTVTDIHFFVSTPDGAGNTVEWEGALEQFVVADSVTESRNFTDDGFSISQALVASPNKRQKLSKDLGTSVQINEKHTKMRWLFRRDGDGGIDDIADDVRLHDIVMEGYYRKAN